MIKKFLILFFIILSLTVIFSSTSSFAQKDKEKNDSVLPEIEGTFNVPNRPDLKVRVFVHGPKPAKPSSTQTPVLVCPTEDPNSTAIVPPVGWHLPSSWTYTLNPGSAPSSVGSGNLTTIAGNAFNAWTSAVPGKVAISQASTASINRARFDGKNIIAWGRASSGTLAVTYTWYYQSTGLVAENDTIFNNRYPWFWNAVNNTCTDSKSYDAQDILTHEIGHWMGLNDTYTNDYINNTMFGYGSKGEVKKNTLTTGDTQGVQAIYP